MQRNKKGQFVSTGKYQKINSIWYKGVCIDCRQLLRHQDAKRCKLCYKKVQTKPKNFKHTTPHTIETINKISEAKKGKAGPWLNKKRPNMTGANNPNWKNGATNKRMKVQSSLEYKQWRTAVFERDNYTCQICGIRNGEGKTVRLEADHIKPYSLYPDLRLSISNGRTLCKPCHRKTPTFGKRILQYER